MYYAEAYLAFPVLIISYIIGIAWKRTLPQRAHRINLDSGRKSWYTAEEMNAVSGRFLFLLIKQSDRIGVVAGRTPGSSPSYSYFQDDVCILNVCALPLTCFQSFLFCMSCNLVPTLFCTDLIK